MRKNYLAILLASLCLNSIHAQRHVKEADLLYMDDGSLYVGTILNRSVEKNFLLNTGDTINVDPFEIHKRRRLVNVTMHRRGKFHFRRGQFVYIYSGGGGDGTSGTSMIAGVLGNRFSKRLSAGLGVSLDYYTETVAGFWVEHAFTTPFGYGRLYLTDTKTRLYFDARLGYALQRSSFFTEDHSNGVNIQPGLGIHFASRNKVKFHLNMAGNWQYVTANSVDPGFFGSGPVELDYSIWQSQVIFTFGIEAW
ncbi:MAG: hypothetical protein AAF616_15215 [Bacteroidota bacterium]